jgi:7,8-dihydropterin-6-yl-methyl-4-(beta-D-ribofuranosyl)aminobenzene 5'-phosphate synthase
VGEHAFTTGQIARRSFENVLSPSTMKIGVENGIGCYPDRMPQSEETKSIVPDQFQHELATAYNLKGRGLVILTACSHRGVVNTIKQAQAASGVTKVHAVIGGFHLAPYAEDYVRQTIAALTALEKRSTTSRSLKCQTSCCAPMPEPASCSRGRSVGLHLAELQQSAV